MNFKDDILPLVSNMNNIEAKKIVDKYIEKDKDHNEVFDSLRTILLTMDASDENDKMFLVAINKSDDSNIVREDANTIIDFIDLNYRKEV